jgi:hypothetical protein
MCSIRSCAGNAKSVALRTAALRALAHFCRSEAFVRSINATGVDYFVVGSLERDATAAATAATAGAMPTAKSANSGNPAAVSANNLTHSNSAGSNVRPTTASSSERAAQVRAERIAALKLVMRMIEHGVESLPRSVLQSLVAIAEAPGDCCAGSVCARSARCCCARRASPPPPTACAR